MIIATAGHVDHGKTALVKALTGIETDRLAEEKRRGLTIELGFAYPQSKGAAELGFVDVPGHERFIHTMLAGVAAIDFALLVVAADDGVMPQTREHVAILDLLGVKRGAVALSKVDAVDDARVDEVERQIQTLLARTLLKGAPVYPVSARAGDGIETLKSHLQRAANENAQQNPTGNFRLCVDRRFSMAGTGLVVTGAVVGGEARIDDHLIVSPQGIDVRLRSIQSRNRAAEIARQGERCALNIAGPGLKDIDVKRGDWIVAAAAHAPAARFDAKLRLLSSEDKPLKHWAQVHLHAGARHDMAHVAILGDKKIEPGAEAYVQIVTDAPVNVWARDRFVVRDASAQRTIGGGYVVDCRPPARGRARPERLAQVAAMDQSTADEALRALLEASPNGVAIESFCSTWNLTGTERAQLLAATPHNLFKAAGATLMTTPGRWEDATGALLRAVETWHGRQPQSLGPDLQALRNSLPLAPNLFIGALDDLLKSRALVRDGARVRLPAHRPQLSPAQEELWRDIEPLLEEGGTKPPVVSGLAEALGRGAQEIEKFLRHAAGLGLVVQVAKNRFYLPDALSELALVAEDLAARSEAFEAKAFRDRAGIGRNLTIDVLEYFDRVRFTERSGDARRVRAAAADIFGGGAASQSLEGRESHPGGAHGLQIR